MPVALLLKPLEYGLARNAARWGVAGLNVAGTRTPADPNVDRVIPTSGRFPGNVLLDPAAAEEAGEQGGWSQSGQARGDRTYFKGSSVLKGLGDRGFTDSGTAARYFQRFKYVGRAPAAERLRCLGHWHWIGDPDNPEGWRRLTTAEALDTPRRQRMTGSSHPTLRPLELTEWISRLILPPLGPETATATGRDHADIRRYCSSGAASCAPPRSRECPRLEAGIERAGRRDVAYSLWG